MTTTTKRQHRRRTVRKLRREQLQSWLARAAPWLNESFCTLNEAADFAREDGMPSATKRRISLANVAAGRPFHPTKEPKENTENLSALQWQRIIDAIRRQREHVARCETVADVSRVLIRMERINKPLAIVRESVLAAVGTSLYFRTERPNFRA